MAIQPMALGIRNPEINALGAFTQGVQARQTAQANELELARQGMQNISAIALGVLGGKLDGQADPALWNEALDMYKGFGVDVEPYRSRPDLANVIARSGLTTIQQLSAADADRNYLLAIDRFGLDLQEALAGPKPTANMIEHAAAVEQGFEGTLEDWVNQPAQPSIPSGYQPAPGGGLQPIPGGPADKANINPTAPAGYRPTADGQALEFIPGGPADPANKPERAEFNVSQAAAAGYADRMVQADAVIANPNLANVQTDAWEQGKAGVPFVGNFLASTEFQQADQARRDFINAILRRESGAVISDSEFANANKQYFPQPGDSPEVLAQKAANRQNAINGVARAAGPAYEYPDTTNYLTGQPAAANGQSGGWEVIGVED